MDTSMRMRPGHLPIRYVLTVAIKSVKDKYEISIAGSDMRGL
jgi:hypothetical protein